MTRDVQITGLGLATPLGGTLGSTWEALLESRYITDHAQVADLPAGNDLRVNRLAAQVAGEAVAEARWTASQARAAALVVGTSKGPVEGWLSPLSSTSDNLQPPAGRCFPLGMGDVAQSLAGELRLESGPVLTLSAACASGLHAIIRAALLIRSGETERVLVVAAESSLHPLFVQSFRRLGVLPREGVGCRPFDRHRAGFLMSEAAAAVCLEAVNPGSIPPGGIWLDRFAMAADATHLTSGDPEGKMLRRLLAHVIDRRPVDLIHAHGTGTRTHDPAELAAIESAVNPGESPPGVYSHKGAIGHSLGASGLISIVINCLSHRHGIIPPNVRTEAPLETTHVTITRGLQRRPIRRSIALAEGFGGPMGVVALQSQ